MAVPPIHCCPCSKPSCPEWHSLSDPELEHSLITRIDFNLFCRFDELSIPDYSTLCRYRNWLAQDDTLSELLELINCQLTEKNLKVEKASAAVIDATLDSDFKCNTRVPVVGTDLRIKHLAFRSQVFFLAGGSTHLEPCVSPDR